MTKTICCFINELLRSRLNAQSLEFIAAAQREIHSGVEDARFTALIALTSRHIPRRLLAPLSTERMAANKILSGWNPQSWSLLETARISLVLSHPDLTQTGFSERFNGWFNYADEGELCALYRAIPLLPEPQRFVWRAAEGCRSNMKSVFTAVACDSPFPAQYFDDIAWNQMLMKALFTEVPLGRVYGLDQRLSTTLAHMVLDFMDERRSAGRDIPVDAWLCLDLSKDPRVDKFILLALDAVSLKARSAAVMALGRAERIDILQQLLNDYSDPRLQVVIQQALDGEVDQYAFHTLISEIVED